MNPVEPQAEGHLENVAFIASRVVASIPTAANRRELTEELTNVGVVAMMEAEARYKEDQGPFWPFVFRRVRGAMLDFLGREFRETCHVELSGVRVSSGDPSPDLERHLDVERAVRRLAPRDRRVFRATRAGHRTKELAGMLRITKSRATRIRQRMERQMREMLVA